MQKWWSNHENLLKFSPECHQYHKQHIYHQLPQFLQEPYWIFHIQKVHWLLHIYKRLLWCIPKKFKFNKNKCNMSLFVYENLAETAKSFAFFTTVFISIKNQSKLTLTSIPFCKTPAWTRPIAIRPLCSSYSIFVA